MVLQNFFGPGVYKRQVLFCTAKGADFLHLIKFFSYFFQKLFACNAKRSRHRPLLSAICCRDLSLRIPLDVSLFSHFAVSFVLFLFMGETSRPCPLPQDSRRMLTSFYLPSNAFNFCMSTLGLRSAVKSPFTSCCTSQSCV